MHNGVKQHLGVHFDVQTHITYIVFIYYIYMEGFVNIINSLVSKNISKPKYTGGAPESKRLPELSPYFTPYDNTKINKDIKDMLLATIEILQPNKEKISRGAINIAALLKNELDKLISSRGYFINPEPGTITTSDKELNIALLMKNELDKLISKKLIDFIPSVPIPSKELGKSLNISLLLKNEIDKLIHPKEHFKPSEGSLNFALLMKNEVDKLLSSKMAEFILPEVIKDTTDLGKSLNLSLLLKNELDKMISRKIYSPEIEIKTSSKSLNFILLLKNELDKLISYKPSDKEIDSDLYLNLTSILKNEIDKILLRKLEIVPPKPIEPLTNDQLNLSLLLKNELDKLISKVPIPHFEERTLDISLLLKNELDKLLSKNTIPEGVLKRSYEPLNISSLLKNELDKLISQKTIEPPSIKHYTPEQLNISLILKNELDKLFHKRITSKKVEPELPQLNISLILKTELEKIIFPAPTPKTISEPKNPIIEPEPKPAPKPAPIITKPEPVITGPRASFTGRRIAPVIPISQRQKHPFVPTPTTPVAPTSGRIIKPTGSGDCDNDAEICKIEYSNDNLKPENLEFVETINMDSMIASELKEVKDEELIQNIIE